MSNEPTIASIDDYETGAIADEDAAVFEEEFFAAAAAGRASALEQVDAMHRIAPWFRSRGGFDASVPRAKLEELRRMPHVHYLELETGRPNEVGEWPADTRMVVYRVQVDLRAYEDVEVLLALPDGTPLKAFRGVLCDPSDGALYAVCDEPLARASFRAIHCLARIEGKRGGKREVVAVVDTRPV